jgi:hypothetical protein
MNNDDLEQLLSTALGQVSTRRPPSGALADVRHRARRLRRRRVATGVSALTITSVGAVGALASRAPTAPTADAPVAPSPTLPLCVTPGVAVVLGEPTAPTTSFLRQAEPVRSTVSWADDTVIVVELPVASTNPTVAPAGEIVGAAASGTTVEPPEAIGGAAPVPVDCAPAPAGYRCRGDAQQPGGEWSYFEYCEPVFSPVDELIEVDRQHNESTTTTSITPTEMGAATSTSVDTTTTTSGG